MKKKIILITLIGTIISFIIYFYTQNNDITIVSLGDGVSTGMTPYLIEGYSYNDYLKDDYKTKHELKAYYEYGSPNMTIKELIYDIKINAKNLKIKK